MGLALLPLKMLEIQFQIAKQKGCWTVNKHPPQLFPAWSLGKLSLQFAFYVQNQKKTCRSSSCLFEPQGVLFPYPFWASSIF